VLEAAVLEPVGPGGLDAEHAVGAVGQAHPVVDDDADDFAKAQGDDGQVVAAHPQGGVADDAPGDGREARRDGQAQPERQLEVHREQGVGVRANAEEGDVAKIEQAGQAYDDVQPQAQDDVHQHADGHVVGVAFGNHGEYHGQGGNGAQGQPPGHAGGHSLHCHGHGLGGFAQESEYAALLELVEHQQNGGGHGNLGPNGETLGELQPLGLDAEKRPKQHKKPGHGQAIAQPELRRAYRQRSLP